MHEWWKSQEETQKRLKASLDMMRFQVEAATYCVELHPEIREICLILRDLEAERELSPELLNIKGRLEDVLHNLGNRVGKMHMQRRINERLRIPPTGSIV